jgi:hypothetical protein
MKVEVLGKMQFTDKINNLTAELEFNDVEWSQTTLGPMETDRLLPRRNKKEREASV